MQMVMAPVSLTKTRVLIKRKLEGSIEGNQPRGDVQKDRLALLKDIVAWRAEQVKMMPGLDTASGTYDENMPTNDTVPSAEREMLRMPLTMVCSEEAFVQESWF